MSKTVLGGVRGALDKLTPDQLKTINYYKYTIARYEAEEGKCEREWLAMTKSEAKGYLKGLRAGGVISETEFRCLHAYLN